MYNISENITLLFSNFFILHILQNNKNSGTTQISMKLTSKT